MFVLVFLILEIPPFNESTLFHLKLFVFSPNQACPHLLSIIRNAFMYAGQAVLSVDGCYGWFPQALDLGSPALDRFQNCFGTLRFSTDYSNKW